MPATLSIIYLLISIYLFIYLFSFAPGLSTLSTHCSEILLSLPSPSSSLSFILTTSCLPHHPTPLRAPIPGRWLKVQSWQPGSSPPLHSLRIRQVYYKLPPLSNTCTEIMPKSCILHPTHKAVNVQRAFCTSPPRKTHTHVQAHTHPNPTSIFLLNLRQNPSEVIPSMLESAFWRMPRPCRLLRNTVLVIPPHPYPNQVSNMSFTK